MFVADDYFARAMENDPAFREMMTAQYAAAGMPLPGISTANSVARPLPGSDAAPTLDQLLGPPPAPVDATVSPSAGELGNVPTFRTSTTQLDWYRIAWLVAGVIIGKALLK